MTYLRHTVLNSKLGLGPRSPASKSSDFSTNPQIINKEELWNRTCCRHKQYYVNLAQLNSKQLVRLFYVTLGEYLYGLDNSIRKQWSQNSRLTGFLFWWKDHLSFFSMYILFRLISMWKVLPLKLVACIVTYYALTHISSIISHICISLNCDVKFHLLFLIFPSAPLLKDRLL